MKIWKPIRIAIWILSPVILFQVSYVVAADYDYPMVSGVYHFKQDAEESTLVLRSDRTFVQERKRNGSVERALGEWHRYGEGGFDLSKEFLQVSTLHPEADGATQGEVRKSFLNLVPYLVLGPDREHGPKFRRVLFHSGDTAQ